MGVGAGLYMYVDVVQKFTFAISSPDEFLLSLWNKVQMICIWSSWCHCHLIISCLIKIQIYFTFLVPAYPDFSGKQAVKQVSVQMLGHNV